MTSLRITRREFAGVAAAGVSSLAPAWMPQHNAVPAAPARLRGGVSLAGAEFGCEAAWFCNRNPGVHGRDYIYPSARSLTYFAENGLGLLRLPFRWERIQPEPGQPLCSDELARLQGVVRSAADCGARVVLDLHNYGRYRLSVFGKPQTMIVDQRVAGAIAISRQHFSDLWRRLAEVFTGDPTVAGFGLMNEPHDLGGANWKEISQAAVNAIRRVNHDPCVIVAGDAWAGAHSFAEANGPKAWIEDPAGNVVYEAHCYFDADGSGRYLRSYAAELAADPALLQRGVQRIGAFLAWLRRNGARGFLGEFGIPKNDPGWIGVLRNALLTLPTSDFSACYWAAGEWWGNYPLSVHPNDNFRAPAPQLALLKELLAS